MRGMITGKVVPTKLDIPDDTNTALKMIGLQEKKSKKVVMQEAFEFYIAHKGVAK